MPFTEIISCTTKTVVPLCLLLWLAACGTVPPQQPGDAPPAVDATAGPAERPAPPPGLDTSAPDDNPYLAQHTEVPDAARVLFNQAVAAMQQAQWQDAERLLRQLTAAHPALSGPHLNLGIVQRHLNNPEQAEQHFRQAIQVNRLNLEAYNQLALLKREAGDFEAAEDYYLDALAIWPKHALSHRNIGILYDLYMGQLSKALQHFDIYQYLQAEPDRQVAGWIIDLKRRIGERTASDGTAGVQP